MTLPVREELSAAVHIEEKTRHLRPAVMLWILLIACTGCAGAEQELDRGDSSPPPATGALPVLQKVVGIPFTKQYEHVIVHGRIGKARARFVVDTGASETIVEAFVAHAAGIRANASEGKRFTGIHSTMRMKQAIAPEISFGEFVLKNLPVNIHNPLSAHGGPGGILGMDILGHYVVTLDFERNQMELAQQLTTVPSNSVTIPIKVVGSPYLSGVINGSATQMFLLDTGAVWPVFLTAQEARHAGLVGPDGSVVPEAAQHKKKFIVDANIAVRHVPRLVLKTLDFGTVRLVDVDAAIVEAPGKSEGTNIVGLPFLQRWAKAILDFPNQRLILVRKQPPQQAHP